MLKPSGSLFLSIENAAANSARGDTFRCCRAFFVQRWRGEGDRSGASGALGVHKSGVPRARARQLLSEKSLHPSPSLANPLNLTALRRQKGEALTFIQSSPCENVRCRSLRQGLFVQKSGEAKVKLPGAKPSPLIRRATEGCEGWVKR